MMFWPSQDAARMGPEGNWIRVDVLPMVNDKPKRWLRGERMNRVEKTDLSISPHRIGGVFIIVFGGSN
jgi:hypothetical protein